MSASEAEIGALFINAKEGEINYLILEDIIHLQPPNLIHCNNSTATGIANGTVKRQLSRSTEMNYLWIADQIAQKLSMLIGTQDKKIWQTTSINTTLECITANSDHIITTWITLQPISLEPLLQGSCQGVL